MKVFPLTLLALVAALTLPLMAQVKIAQADEGRITIEIGGKPYSTLFYGPGTTKPYLYPLLTASGKSVTRHFPMEQFPGETHDHPHHRGLFFAHGDVNGLDFWGNDPLVPSPKGGTIVLEKVNRLKSGKKSGSIDITFDHNDRSGKTLLTEHRLMVFHDEPTERIIDFDATLTAKEKVTFGDTKEGTFAIRLATEMQADKHTGHIVDAEGAEGEKNVWGKKSHWVDYYGEVQGEKVGVAILDNPHNPGSPVRWHVRAYGLFAANPFGLADFVGDKSQKGGMTVEPGQSLRFRYRVIIHPGDAQSAGIAAAYEKYAAAQK